MITGVAEEVRKYLEVLVEGAVEVGSGTETPVILPREDGVAGWGAGRGRNVGVVKEHTLLGDGVEGRSLDDVVIGVNRGVGPAPVVSDTEQDIGLTLGGEDGGGREENENGK